MNPAIAKKAIFCLNNYGLLHRNLDMGDSLADFSGSMLVDEAVVEELRAKRLHALRRGRLITDAELLEAGPDGEEVEGEAEEAEGEAGEEGAEQGEADATAREVKWAPLVGLKVLPKPAKLD
eukprot:6113118-Prymnesium_polylepis.1